MRHLAAVLALALLSPPLLADDVFEENDTSAAAAAIPAGTYENLRADDADWYAITVPAGGSLDVSIEFAHSSGDLDVLLYSPAGAVVARSEGTTNSEAVRSPAGTSGKFQLHVFGYRGARNAYRMIVRVSGAADDTYEDNDTLAGSRSIAAGNHALTLLDDDWFSIAVGAGSSISADILFDHARGDLDLVLHAADGTRLAASEGTTNQETVSWTAAAAATVHVRVFGYQGAKGTYELRLRVSTATTAAADPLQRGPHAVGEVRGTIFDSARQKNVEVILHYPATADGVGTPIARTAGPFSLISHGHGRYGAWPVNPPNMLGWNYLYEHLASHGFYVIAPNLDVNSIAPEPAGQPERQILENSADMRYGLTFMLNSSASTTSSFAGTVDASKVGIMGHSRGGEASIHAGQVDSRVKTVVSIAPTDFHGFLYSGKPVLLWNATHDCDVAPHYQQAIFDRWPGDIRLVTVIGGGHFLWTDAAGPICSVPLDRATQHRVTMYYVLAFLDTRLRGNDVYRDAYLQQIASTRLQQK